MASKSKIPPQVFGAGFEAGQIGGESVEVFGFHDDQFRCIKNGIIAGA